MQRQLRATTGPLAGSLLSLTARTVIGRGGDADVQLIDDRVSRQHALLAEDDGGAMVLVDLGSANGTRVGGKEIVRHRLAPADVIEVGSSSFVFEEVSEGAAGKEPEEQVIKLLSGPAEVDTRIDRAGAGAAAGRGCGDPLHDSARHEGWAYCPRCGQSVR